MIGPECVLLVIVSHPVEFPCISCPFSTYSMMAYVLSFVMGFYQSRGVRES